MSIFLTLLVTNAFLIKERSTNKYLSWNGQELKTGDVDQAVDFEIEKTNFSNKFIIKKKGTDLVMDDPGSSHASRLYLHKIHRKDNQQFSFVLNRKGTFDIICGKRKVVYSTNSDTFIVTSDLTNDDGEFIIVDKGTPYSDFFEVIPIEQKKATFDAPVRKNLLKYEPSETEFSGNKNKQLKSKIFGRIFMPQTHKDRLYERMMHLYLPYESTI
ncbi:hypothetical protein TUBRATIS_25650 [Tubulinosema ratisbonensis]|uniref:Ricin B lectin domain-containing protein n=1 Tax=Tubulinosema ratisbonensis TaxID=291195 RepID=A0A437AIL3_9MICR|nr:hypothetical protein TUBRATIS_25650 [Tubulinosema ratisbonensis]